MGGEFGHFAIHDIIIIILIFTQQIGGSHGF